MPRQTDIDALDEVKRRDDVSVKGRLGSSIGSTAREAAGSARRKPKLAAYDPDPVNADGDLLVQEGTTQERPDVDVPDVLKEFLHPLRVEDVELFERVRRTFPMSFDEQDTPQQQQAAVDRAVGVLRSLDAFFRQRPQAIDERWHRDYATNLAVAAAAIDRLDAGARTARPDGPDGNEPDSLRGMQRALDALTPEERNLFDLSRENQTVAMDPEAETRTDLRTRIRHMEQYLGGRAGHLPHNTYVQEMGRLAGMRDVLAKIPELSQERMDQIDNMSISELRDELSSIANNLRDGKKSGISGEEHLYLAERLAERMYEMRGTDKKGNKWRSELVNVEVDGHGDIHFSGNIYNDGGVTIGAFNRSLNMSDLRNSVSHHSINMDAEAQGRGIGTAFVNRSMLQARDAGFDDVELMAVSGDGYNGLTTWPKLGFTLQSMVDPQLYSSRDQELYDELEQLAGVTLDYFDEQMLIDYADIVNKIPASAMMELSLHNLPSDLDPPAQPIHTKDATAPKPRLTADEWNRILDDWRFPTMAPQRHAPSRRPARFRDTARGPYLGRTVKSLPRIGQIASGGGKRPPKPAVYDPDAVNADGDFTAQDGTTAEHPDVEALLREGTLADLRAALQADFKAYWTQPNHKSPGVLSEEQRRRVVRRLAEGLYNMSGRDHDGRPWTSAIVAVDPYPGSNDVYVDGFILDENGDRIGRFSRAMSIEGSHIYHSIFEMNWNHQGRGIGSAFVNMSMHQARQAGFTQIRLTAANGPEYNGLRTWPKLGFRLVGPIDFEDDPTDIERYFGKGSDSITTQDLIDYGDALGDIAASAEMQLDLATLPPGPPPGTTPLHAKADQPQPATPLSWEDWADILDTLKLPNFDPKRSQGRNRRSVAPRGRHVERKNLPGGSIGAFRPHGSYRRVVPYDPTPINADNDELVQEGTIHERPATPLDAAARIAEDVARGAEALSSLRSSNTVDERRAATTAAHEATPAGAAIRRGRSTDALIEKIRAALPDAQDRLAERRQQHADAIQAGKDKATVDRLASDVVEAEKEVADYLRMLDYPDGPPPNEPPSNPPGNEPPKPPRFTRDQIQQLVQKVRENEGFTVNANNAEDQVSGYAVGIGTGEYSGVIDAGRFMTDDEFAITEVQKWLEQHDELLSSDQVDHIGAWYDTQEGKVILDPVQVVPDDGPYSPNPTDEWRSHAEDRALELCRARNQRSMFHLDTFRTVWCGGSGGYASDTTGRAEPIRLPMTLPDRLETIDQFFPSDRVGHDAPPWEGSRQQAADAYETALKEVWFQWDGARQIRAAAWDIMGADPTGIDPQISRRQTPEHRRIELEATPAHEYARYILSRMLDRDHGGHDRGELYRGIRLTPEEAVAMFGDAEAEIQGIVKEGGTFDMPPMSFAERLHVGVQDLTEFYGNDVLLVVKGNPRAMRLMPMVGPLYDEGDEEAFMDMILDPAHIEASLRETGITEYVPGSEYGRRAGARRPARRSATDLTPEELQAHVDAIIADIEASYEAYKQKTYRELDLVEGQRLGIELGDKIVQYGLAEASQVTMAGMSRDDYDSDWEDYTPNEVLTGGRFYVRSIYPDPRGRYGKIVEVEQVGVIDPATGKMVDTNDISKNIKGFSVWLIDLL